MTHESIWNAIEKLARTRGMSCTALARASGLNFTTFNRSKRYTANGRPRWPSVESIAKILDATNTNVVDFAKIIAQSDN